MALSDGDLNSFFFQRMECIVDQTSFSSHFLELGFESVSALAYNDEFQTRFVDQMLMQINISTKMIVVSTLRV